MAEPRDPDLVDIIARLRADVDEITKNVIARTGRVPHLAADPATLVDGKVWARSDDLGYRYRANGTTVAVPRGLLAAHSLTTVFNTAATHTTLQDEGLTVTVSEVAGRKLKFTLQVNPYVPGGANGVNFRLLRDGVSMRDWFVPTEALSTGTVHSITFTHQETVAVTHVGSVFKIQLAAFSTNTQVASSAAATFPRVLLVEDVGA